MPTIHALVASARARLAAAGIGDEEAALDARLLGRFVRGWDAATLLTQGGEEGPSDFPSRYDALVARRAAREPMAYILGHQEFWGLDFEVTPAVLIPRPETELILEVAFESLGTRLRDGNVERGAGGEWLRAVDVGTGSGCLAVALAHDRPDARIVATDVSSAALEVARRNAARHAVGDRIQFVETDLFAGLQGPFDLVLSNPPYVPGRDRDTLQPEVRDHEPSTALFSGDEGLDAIGRLIREAPRVLVPHGFLIFEFGFGQAETVKARLHSATDLSMIGLRNDIQQVPRVAVARRVR